MKDGFYRAFEDFFRDGREFIKTGSRACLHFIEPLLLSCPASAIEPGGR
jgi:hypothetical protein